jgi:6-pyruvoyltetrahydropterin/6-carboxytetrahydropterin synthase
MKIGRIFHFDAAHFLPDYKGKCEKVHGHTYKMEVVIEDEVKDKGMVMDFTELGKIVEINVIEKFDHENLNELMENPTAENIAKDIFKRLDKLLPLLSVKVWEGEGKWVLVEK